MPKQELRNQFNQSLYDDWHGVLIFPDRSLKPTNTTIHRSLLNGFQVQRIYLDELGRSQSATHWD